MANQSVPYFIFANRDDVHDTMKTDGVHVAIWLAENQSSSAPSFRGPWPYIEWTRPIVWRGHARCEQICERASEDIYGTSPIASRSHKGRQRSLRQLLQWPTYSRAQAPSIGLRRSHCASQNCESWRMLAIRPYRCLSTCLCHWHVRLSA